MIFVFASSFSSSSLVSTSVSFSRSFRVASHSTSYSMLMAPSSPSKRSISFFLRFFAFASFASSSGLAARALRSIACPRSGVLARGRTGATVLKWGALSIMRTATESARLRRSGDSSVLVVPADWARFLLILALIVSAVSDGAVSSFLIAPLGIFTTGRIVVCPLMVTPTGSFTTGGGGVTFASTGTPWLAAGETLIRIDDRKRHDLERSAHVAHFNFGSIFPNLHHVALQYGDQVVIVQPTFLRIRSRDRRLRIMSCGISIAPLMSNGAGLAGLAGFAGLIDFSSMCLLSLLRIFCIKLSADVFPLTVSHTFMLQQFSIVISHCVVGGREVIGVTTIFLVMRGRGGFIIRLTTSTTASSSANETVLHSLTAISHRWPANSSPHSHSGTVVSLPSVHTVAKLTPAPIQAEPIATVPIAPVPFVPPVAVTPGAIIAPDTAAALGADAVHYRPAVGIVSLMLEQQVRAQYHRGRMFAPVHGAGRCVRLLGHFVDLVVLLVGPVDVIVLDRNVRRQPVEPGLQGALIVHLQIGALDRVPAAVLLLHPVQPVAVVVHRDALRQVHLLLVHVQHGAVHGGAHNVGRFRVAVGPVQMPAAFVDRQAGQLVIGLHLQPALEMIERHTADVGGLGRFRQQLRHLVQLVRIVVVEREQPILGMVQIGKVQLAEHLVVRERRDAAVLMRGR
uniref:Uncharacterized protein n=1 Tax=Anopheles coluzzii TaxID=1518534 RepID=A0A8W7PGC6_ANOCL